MAERKKQSYHPRPSSPSPCDTTLRLGMSFHPLTSQGLGGTLLSLLTSRYPPNLDFEKTGKQKRGMEPVTAEQKNPEDDLASLVRKAHELAKVIPAERRLFVHHYDQARKDLKPGQVPLLKFQAGDAHILLPTGQHLRQKKKDTAMSPRQRKREMKLYRRQEKQFAQVSPVPKPDDLAHEIARWGQLPLEECVRLVQSGDLPFNVAVRLEQHGANRMPVLEALAAVAKPGDVEVVEVGGKDPAAPADQVDTAALVPAVP